MLHSATLADLESKSEMVIYENYSDRPSVFHVTIPMLGNMVAGNEAKTLEYFLSQGVKGDASLFKRIQSYANYKDMIELLCLYKIFPSNLEEIDSYTDWLKNYIKILKQKKAYSLAFQNDNKVYDLLNEEKDSQVISMTLQEMAAGFARGHNLERLYATLNIIKNEYNETLIDALYGVGKQLGIENNIALSNELLTKGFCGVLDDPAINIRKGVAWGLARKGLSLEVYHYLKQVKDEIGNVPGVILAEIVLGFTAGFHEDKVNNFLDYLHLNFSDENTSSKTSDILGKTILRIKNLPLDLERECDKAFLIRSLVLNKMPDALVSLAMGPHFSLIYKAQNNLAIFRMNNFKEYNQVLAWKDTTVLTWLLQGVSKTSATFVFSIASYLLPPISLVNWYDVANKAAVKFTLTRCKAEFNDPEYQLTFFSQPKKKELIYASPNLSTQIATQKR